MTTRAEVEALTSELRNLGNRSEQVIDEFKAAQHNLFALSEQDALPEKVEKARCDAVNYYEAFLDMQIEINIKNKRLRDMKL